MTRPFNEGWFTLLDVAKILRVSPSTVRRLITSGRLQANNTSCATRPRWRIHELWLEEYATCLPVQPEKKEASNATMQTSEN